MPMDLTDNPALDKLKHDTAHGADIVEESVTIHHYPSLELIVVDAIEKAYALGYTDGKRDAVRSEVCVHCNGTGRYDLSYEFCDGCEGKGVVKVVVDEEKESE